MPLGLVSTGKPIASKIEKFTPDRSKSPQNGGKAIEEFKITDREQQKLLIAKRPETQHEAPEGRVPWPLGGS